MSNPSLKLLGHAHVRGSIRVRTGLHIGAGKDTIEIGGIDNPIVKHPLTKEPYIPGSSLKGKLRFLLEWSFNKIDVVNGRGEIYGAGGGSYSDDDPILRIFGTTYKKWSGGPTRLMVRDAFLADDWKKLAKDPDTVLVEEKTEVAIDRIAGKAMDGRLRTTERVPAGVAFALEMIFRLYDTGDGGVRDKECLNWLLAGLSLLEQDALGGSGSRGYGRVAFEDLRIRKPDGSEEEIGARFRVNRFDPDTAPDIVKL